MKPRLAVIELHHLGDAVLALPFLRGAKQKWRPILCCRPTVAQFFEVAAAEIEILKLPEGWIARWFYIRKFLRLGVREAAACVWPDPRAHALMLATGAGLRAGFAVSARNFYSPKVPRRARRLAIGQGVATLLNIITRGHTLTPPLFKSSASQHHLETWEQLARSLGFSCDTRLPWIGRPSAKKRGHPLHFVLHPGGRLPSKRWPTERFESLLRTVFAPRDWLVSIVQVPGEPCPEPMSLGQRIVRTENFQELISLLQSADAVVCNDSFPAHLAAALGKPVVAIFGSGEPAWFAPFRNAQYAVASNACPHRPCLDHCVMPSFICLEGVRVEDVEVALEKLARNLAKSRNFAKKA